MHKTVLDWIYPQLRNLSRVIYLLKYMAGDKVSVFKTVKGELIYPKRSGNKQQSKGLKSEIPHPFNSLIIIISNPLKY